MGILAMEEEEEEHIRISSSSSSLPNSNSMESATVGLVMNTLLTARPKKLQEAISRLDSAPKNGPIGVSLEQSLWILHMYIKDEAGKGEPLDQVLVPMIEHSLKCKGSKNNNRAMILLNWLFQDEFYFRSLATNLANILVRKDDNFIALGWCILGRSLIEYEITMNQLLTNGIKEKRNALLKILCSCVTHLLSIIRHGSTLQDGFEFPTRLSVAAADFIIALTVALTRKEMVSNIPNNQTKSSINPELKNISGVTAIGRRKVKPLSVPSESSSEMEMKLLLWNLLDELTVLMQKLVAWNKKSRPMHAEGLERVVMWLQETKRRYGHFQEVAGSQMVKTGTLLLSSCWKYYGVLLHLEDPKISHQYRELLDQYLSGIEFYADNYAEDGSENKESGIETINFFLSCLLLLLGRLDAKQFENVMSEYGARISSVLILQLRSGDEDVINGAVFLIKSAIFTTNNSLSRSSLIDNVHMNALLPSLLHLLDEQDGTARAAIMLIAEYCFMSSDNKCLEEVLKRLTTGEVVRRKNAVDVIAEVVRISSDSVEASLSHSTWEDIAEHLLDCLGDEDMVIGERASKLIPMLDASLVLPSLIRCIYLSNERVELSASTTLVAVLQYHNQKFDVICMLLDCLSNLSQMLNRPNATDDQLEGLKFDTDKVLKLIPEWSKSVEDWNLLIKPLIKKMFSEPSNATIVRFLSYISEHLADNADEVFTSLLLHTGKQKEMDKYLFPECDAGRSHTEGVVELQQSLFSRLCPLLILRLLPLRVFNNVKSSLLYGEILSQQSDHDNRYFSIHEIGGVAALLLNSAFNKFEFEDVRKLAAELCGRIHPQVLFPFISSQLGHAVNSHDILKITASLFSICTSLVVRGTESLWHPDVLEIRKTIETILLWPSTDGDEISKAQHGCIDCLALMVCTEMQAIKSSTESNFNKTSIPAKNCSGNSSSPGSPHAYILHQLISDKEELIRSTNFGTKNSTFSETVLSYRLCMANVLISACQKVSTPGRKSFAKTILPLLIKSIGAIKESEVRAACIQVLFSAVYHLKSAVSSCSPDLLKVAIKSLKDGSEKERVAGAKLMASLMASEDVVLQSISGGLIEAAPLLSTLSSSDSSPDLRHVCQKLLLCMTSQ